MVPDDVALRPLDPGQKAVLRWRAVPPAALLVALAVADAVLAPPVPWPRGLSLVLALFVAGWTVGLAPSRRYRRWRYAFTGRELHVAHGWLVRVRTVVPVARVQHIDLRQGPAERHHGVATLVLHTAGTEHSQVAVPGLAQAEAERIRDHIRAAAGADPA